MTLRSILRWALPGLFAYLVFLCATFPAAYLVHWLKPDPHGLELSAVSGSVWSGQAGQLVRLWLFHLQQWSLPKMRRFCPGI